MKHVIGIADMRASALPGDVLVTYALGSCLGVVLHDPVAGVGGMLHAMLPSSQIDPAGAATNPFRFVDTGVPALFGECYRLGARKERMTVKVAGGARAAAPEVQDSFEVGKRNFLMLRKLFWKNGVLIDAHDVGGHDSRTLELEVGSGALLLRVGRERKRL